MIGSTGRWALSLAMALLLLGGVPAEGSSEQHRKEIYHELNLTREQTGQLEALESRTKALSRQRKSQLKERREELEDVYRRYHLDEQRARRLRAEIRDIQGQLLELHHSFQEGLRRILTSSQFGRLEHELRERD